MQQIFHLLEILLRKPSACQRRAANPNPPRRQSTLIPWHRVLIRGHVGQLHHPFHTGAIHLQGGREGGREGGEVRIKVKALLTPGTVFLFAAMFASSISHFPHARHPPVKEEKNGWREGGRRCEILSPVRCHAGKLITEEGGRERGREEILPAAASNRQAPSDYPSHPTQGKIPPSAASPPASRCSSALALGTS